MDVNWKEIILTLRTTVEANKYSYFSSVLFVSLGYALAVFTVLFWKKQKKQKRAEEDSNLLPCPRLLKWKHTTSDNTIYLTRFHFQNWFLLLFTSIAYGIVTYFSHVINLICLFICMGQIYEYDDYRSFPSLCIFAWAHACMETYEQVSKFRAQKKINQTRVIKVNNADVHINTTTNKRIEISQYQLRRGDKIPLSTEWNSIVPADVILVRGEVFVDEQQLTGEKTIVCKNHFFSFEKSEYNTEKQDYDPRHVVYRGTRIVDRCGIGVVIRTGNDCEMYRTSHDVKKPPNGIQKKITFVSVCNLYLLLLLSTTGALTVFYYEEKTISFWTYLKQLVLLLNTIIPLSLYFCYHSASWILAKKLEHQTKIHIQPHGTCTFQNQTNSVVSDKTGTLTTNLTILNRVALEFTFNLVNLDLVEPSDNETKEETSLSDSCVVEVSHLKKNPPLCREIANRALSITDLALHSQTKELLCSNDLEFTLLNTVMKWGNVTLHNNVALTGGTLHYSYLKEEIKTATRMLYVPYDSDLEVKYCILTFDDEKSKQCTIHVQGTPEKICSLAHEKQKAEALLKKLEENSANLPNHYHRIIGYGSKTVTWEKVRQLLDWQYLDSDTDIFSKKKDGKLALKDLQDLVNITFYDFLDELVSGVTVDIHQLLVEKCKFSILSGDKYQSNLEVARKLSLLQNENFFSLESLDDLKRWIQKQSEYSFRLSEKEKDSVCFINGRLLFDLTSKCKSEFRQVCNHYKRRVVYRATPHAKQIFIRFLQQETNETVFFIGDGANDVVSALEAASSAAVSTSCGQLLETADFTIRDWHDVPLVLHEFKKKQWIIHNVTAWVLMKHFQTAAHLFLLFFMSEFQVLKDPASPFLMNGFNATLFLIMCVYCWTENSTSCKQVSFLKLIIKGIFLGGVNASLVFHVLDGNEGIFLLIQTQVFQLSCQLERFSEKNTERFVFNILVSLVWFWIGYLMTPHHLSYLLGIVTFLVFIE